MSDLPTWRVDKEEAFAWLAKQADGAFDVTLTDPPYTDIVHANVKNIHSAKTKDKGNKRKDKVDVDFPPFTVEDVERCTSELLRVTRRWVVVTCAIEQVGLYKHFAGNAYIRGGFYLRAQNTPQLSGDRPGQAGEGVVVLRPSGWDEDEDGGAVIVLHGAEAKHWNSGGEHAFWKATRDGGQRLHPTQKPVSLYLQWVEQFSLEGETICDPFAGSGTTGEAALNRGRSFVGAEPMAHYHAIATDRCAAASKGQSLLNYRRSQMTLFPPQAAPAKPSPRKRKK